LYFIRSPQFLKQLFPSIIWDLENQDVRLRISFDDGPSQHTHEILDILDAHQTKASFFCLGRQVEKYPEQYKRIKASGHLIGHHGYAHLDGWRVTKRAYIADLMRAESIIESDYFRPAYGRLKWDVYQKIKKEKKIVMWSMMLGDFDTKVNIEKCKSRLEKATPSDILLLHDNERSYPKNVNLLSSVIKQF